MSALPGQDQMIHVVRAGSADTLKSVDFGPPLHILIVPAELHDMERSYLERFAGL